MSAAKLPISDYIFVLKKASKPATMMFSVYLFIYFTVQFYSFRGFLVKFSVVLTVPSIEEEAAGQVTDFALPPDFLIKDKMHVIIM